MKKLLNKIRGKIRPKAAILMYHRIIELESDVWDIAVSPANFEEQLQVLQKGGKVISLKAMAEDLAAGKVKRGSIALTFDDGYADNFTHAMPLLQKYQLPATFFITSGNLGQEKEFWWDELEQLLLYTAELPQSLSMPIGREQISFELGSEARLSDALRQTHQNWQGCEQEPPTLRAQAYFKVWQAMRPLAHRQQQETLAALSTWAGTPRRARQSHRSMTSEQLKQLAGQQLFHIGIHTVNHPALAYHSAEFQEKEILENKQELERISGRQMQLMAYPFGNFSEASVAIAAKEGLLAAVTTKEQSLKKGDHLYRLPRFQVKNWQAASFEQQLQHWFKKF